MPTWMQSSRSMPFSPCPTGGSFGSVVVSGLRPCLLIIEGQKVAAGKRAIPVTSRSMKNQVSKGSGGSTQAEALLELWS